MDEAQRRPDFAEVAVELATALDDACADRDRRRAAGEDTAVLDALLVKFEAAADDAGVHLENIAVYEEMQAVIQRYAPGPWPSEELAAVAGVDPAAARQVLEDLVREGLVQRPEQPPL
jgi:hypothetical protein